MFVQGAIQGFGESPETRKSCDRKIAEIKTKDLKAIVDKMKDEQFSHCRMLRQGVSLKRIVLADKQTLNSLGLTPSDTAQAFKDLIKAARSTTSEEWKRAYNTEKPADVSFQTSGMLLTDIGSMSKMKLYLKTDTVQIRNDFLSRPVKNVSSWLGQELKDIPYVNLEWSMSRRESAEVKVSPELKYVVFEVTWGGSQICPFHPEGAEYRGYDYGSHDYVFYKYVDGRKVDKMFLSELSLHMIECHGFFGGAAPYRVDPKRAVEFLGIKPKQGKTIIADCAKGQKMIDSNLAALKV